MLKAWDSAFIDDMRYKYSEYQDKTDSEIFRSWADNFTFKYGNLFPEPESITQDNNAKKLDNLLKAQQLGANIADIQEELNESEIFKNEMELDAQSQGMDAADDEAMFNYSNADNEIKADAKPIPPNTEWKTLDNGEHILVNENGTIIAGAGGNLKGKYYKNQETGKFEKYTFNQQSLAEEAEREYNENKQKEIEHKNKKVNKENVKEKRLQSQLIKMTNELNQLEEKSTNSELNENEQKQINGKMNRLKSWINLLEKDLQNINEYDLGEIRDITKTEYTQNRKKLLDLEQSLEYYIEGLYSIHPNNKKEVAEKEELIENTEIKIEKIKAENKKYEETKKQVNKGDKESKEKPAKEKKIGKTYSIAYDNDTIEKLKSLGKTWQDKRIYFKDLNNSYYDLVSEKWVTDSPETTKKAMEMASESLEDRENRLANAKKEAEEKKRREYEEKEAKEKPLRNSVANKIKNREEFTNQVLDKVKEYGYNYIEEGSVNKIANDLFTKEELNAWKNANPYSSEIKDVLRQGDYQYNTHDEIDITPKSLIYDIMKNHFYAKKQNDKPLSFEDFLEVTNDTILDLHSKSEAWEMYGNEYRDYLKEHKKRLNNN